MTDDEDRAVRVVARLGRLLERGLDDLTLPQYRVLAAVDDGGERATMLARGLALAKPTVTAAVDGLVQRGYLVREPVAGDRRSVRIALTPAGRQALAGAEDRLAERLGSVLDRVPDRAATVAQLLAMGAALDILRAEALAGHAREPG